MASTAVSLRHVKEAFSRIKGMKMHQSYRSFVRFFVGERGGSNGSVRRNEASSNISGRIVCRGIKNFSPKRCASTVLEVGGEIFHKQVPGNEAEKENSM